MAPSESPRGHSWRVRTGLVRQRRWKPAGSFGEPTGTTVAAATRTGGATALEAHGSFGEPTGTRTAATTLLALDDAELPDGHEAEALALLEASGDAILYADTSRSGTDTPLDGELGVGPDDTLISRVWVLTATSGLTLRINDDDNPATLALGTYLSSGGAGNDLYVHFQTADGVASFPVADTILTQVGPSWANFTVPDADEALIGGISTGDRFIFGFTREAAAPTRTGNATALEALGSFGEPTGTKTGAGTRTGDATALEAYGTFEEPTGRAIGEAGELTGDYFDVPPYGSKLRYGIVSGPEWLRIEGNKLTGVTPSVLATTTYDAVIRAFDASGQAITKEIEIEVEYTATPPSGAGAITLSSITANSAIAGWASIPGATTYEIEVDGTITTGLTSRQHQITFTRPEDVPIRVRGRNVDGPGTWSTLQTLNFLETPSAPTLTSREGRISNGSSEWGAPTTPSNDIGDYVDVVEEARSCPATLGEWRILISVEIAAVSAATKYLIQSSPTTNFDSAETVDLGTDRTYEFDSDSGRYFRCAVGSNAGQTPWSSVLTVSALSLDDAIPAITRVGNTISFDKQDVPIGIKVGFGVHNGFNTPTINSNVTCFSSRFLIDLATSVAFGFGTVRNRLSASSLAGDTISLTFRTTEGSTVIPDANIDLYLYRGYQAVTQRTDSYTPSCGVYIESSAVRVASA